MAIKLLGQALLEEDHFLSATEQDGEYCDQPEPGANNVGSMRPVVSRDIEDFIISSTTTGAGDSNATSLIDSGLSIFGDQFWVGAKVVLSDDPSIASDIAGEERTVSGFTQSTGELVVSSAFTDDVPSGTPYTLTMEFDDVDFRLELLTAGNPGEANFKWSHDGGNTWLGRMDPTTVPWTVAQVNKFTATGGGLAWLFELSNGNWFFLYDPHTAPPASFGYRISTDKGMTWSDYTLVEGFNSPGVALHLSTGRIMIIQYTLRCYSDDDGVTWTTVTVPTKTCQYAIELPNGNILGFNWVTDLNCFVSTDGGFIWGSNVVVSDAANTQRDGCACLNQLGEVVCVYSSDELSTGNYEIKCKISGDGGASWSDVIDVMNYSGANLQSPFVCLDIDGSLYCMVEDITNDLYEVARSTDNGETWTYLGVLYD
ncbi:MAG: sialidase family protein, partial [Planctomycetota bacterium]